MTDNNKEKASKKILRIGIIHRGNIIEERLIRKRGNVTVGYSPKNTFILPIAKLPESYPLFVEKKGRYLLKFTKGMAGKVTINEEIYELSSLRESSYVKKQGEFYYLPLDDKSRGKLIFEDVTLLFQFVGPPPPTPKLQLPAQAKGAWFRNIEPFFATIMLVSFLIHAGFIGGLEYWWKTSGQFRVKQIKRDRYEIYQLLKSDVQFVQKKEIQVTKGEGEVEGKKEGEKGEKGGEEKKPQKKFTKAAGTGEEDKEAKYRKQLAKVQSETIIKFLVSASEEGEEGIAGAKVMHGPRATDIWGSKGGVKVATDSDEISGYRGGPKGLGMGGGNTYAKLDASDMGDSIKTGQVIAGEKEQEVMIKMRIGGELGSQSGMGKINKDEVAAVFKRRIGAIRTCYEKGLKVNNNLEGKVTIKFTIGEAGRITSIDVIENTTGDSTVAACIVSKVQTWKFSPPEEGSVTFSYPFLLSKG